MKTVQFFKIDWQRSRSQIKFLVLFVAISIIFYINSDGYSWASLYLYFVAIMFSAYPFTVEQISESGFINMLPGKQKDKVQGRFLFGFVLFAGAFIINAALFTIMQWKDNGGFLEGYFIRLLMFGVVLLLGGLQNIMFYIIGKGKSQQIMSFIRIIPSFVLLFGGTALMNFGKNNRILLFSFFFQHNIVIETFVFVFGCFFYVLAILISAAIVKQRDFS